MSTSIIQETNGTHFSGYEKEKGKGLPSSLLCTIKYLPENHQATLIMRHGERLDLPTMGIDNVLLTEHGKGTARNLGTILSNKQPGLLVSSPKERCIETLRALVEGAEWKTPHIITDQLVAPSNPFIIDLDQAVRSFQELGGPTLFNKQITNSIPPPGMGSTSEGVKKVIDAYVQKDDQNPNLLNIVVTHDAVLTVFVGYIFDITFSDDDWPEFLNGVLLWINPQGLNVVWRGNHKVITSS